MLLTRAIMQAELSYAQEAGFAWMPKYSLLVGALMHLTLLLPSPQCSLPFAYSCGGTVG